MSEVVDFLLTEYVAENFHGRITPMPTMEADMMLAADATQTSATVARPPATPVSYRERPKKAKIGPMPPQAEESSE